MTNEQKEQQAREQISNITLAVLDILKKQGTTPYVGATVGAIVLVQCTMQEVSDDPNDESEDVDMDVVKIAATKWLHMVLKDMERNLAS